MALSIGALWSRLIARRELLRWRARAAAAGTERVSLLRAHRAQALRLREELDLLIHVGGSRLMSPATGAVSVSVPFESDWSWRPELWRGPLAQCGISGIRSGERLGEEVSVFHDAMKSEISLRQVRNTRESDLAPFGLRMDVFHFEGSFLSIVVDLPEDAMRDLKRRHVVRLDIQLQLERPVGVLVRLNVQHGPNTEQLSLPLSLEQTEPAVEFDLAYSSINEKRIGKVWVDVMFDRPVMNEMILRDLTVSRHMRADL